MRATRFDPVSFSLGKDEGGGGTTDYDALSNKPSIGGVTLSGDKTAADLGLAAVSELPTQVSDLTNDSGFQDAQQVEDKINAKISSAYKAGGSATIATLPPLTAAKLGVVVNMTQDFTTTADFLEGAGKTYPAGTNVVVAEVSENVYKYDVLAGFVDLSGYVEDTRKVGGVPLSADIPVALTGDAAITVTNTGTASAIGYSVSHNDSGVTAGSKGDTTNQTPGFGDTFKALSATVDAKGHVTALEEHTVKIPDTEATQSAKGLMSPADKAKLDTLIDATLSDTGKAAEAKATGDKIAALESENALLRELVNGIDAPIYRNASGNPAIFHDGAAANVKELSVTITPTQSGSGDPSPDNVRPISGATSVSVTRTGANGANPQTVTVQLIDGANPLTVYGGTLNVTAGELTVTSGVITMDGTQTIREAELKRFHYDFTDARPLTVETQRTETSVLSEFAPSGTWLSISANAWACAPSWWGGVAFKSPDFTDTTEWSAYFAEHPTKFVYPLRTPVTYQLTPQQLATLSGYNSVTTDAGTLSITYRADPKLSFGGG